MNFVYNPEHAIGTCGDCGREMIHNIPRLGDNGGFIHKENHSYMCPPRNPSGEVGVIFLTDGTAQSVYFDQLNFNECGVIHVERVTNVEFDNGSAPDHK